jgi:hypothetical protein
MPEKGTLPVDIPTNPHRTYVISGWKGVGDWLGTGTVANYNKIYRPFEEARAFARSLKLKTSAEWRKFCKGQMPEIGIRPDDIPTNPNKAYEEEGWKGMGDWLGTGTIATHLRVYLPFEKARAFVHSLELKSQTEWSKFCKGQMPEKETLPLNIPAKPSESYAEKGWKGFGDWLGTGTIAARLRTYLPFEEARAFVHTLKLKNQDEWNKFCKGQIPEKGMRPADIPTNPNKTYEEKGWKGMGDWLGTGTIAPKLRVYLPFEEARAFARNLKLKSSAEWNRFCKGQMPKKGTLPLNIPANPNQTYEEKGWKGMGDWLGTGTIAARLRTYLPFEEARAFVHSLKLKSQTEWENFCKGQMPEKGTLPVNIPSAARSIYAKKGWKGMRDWLGTE